MRHRAKIHRRGAAGWKSSPAERVLEVLNDRELESWGSVRQLSRPCGGCTFGKRLSVNAELLFAAEQTSCKEVTLGKNHCDGGEVSAYSSPVQLPLATAHKALAKQWHTVRHWHRSL